jgi:hypothetical protein
VFVSVTDFRVHKLRDIPSVAAAGARLRRGWPQLPGAVGLWTWIDLPQRRVGSVSVWTSEADLSRFLGSPEHVAIMKKFRARMAGSSTAWRADRFTRADIWRRAKSRITAMPAPEREEESSPLST